MGEQILITGGAGFIGSHLADELIRVGHRVRILDNLSAQVHEHQSGAPHYLNADAELIVGDVRDPGSVRRVLKGVDVVYHLAAKVGVGQSMYEVSRYVEDNNLGTAVLMQMLIEQRVKRMIVASSMSIYGEGFYLSPEGAPRAETERTLEQLKAGDWEVRDAGGCKLTHAPTPETKRPSLNSIYALSKYDQECMCLMIGRAYGIPTVALRFFNVYGPRQSLRNPYTGIVSIFASRILNGNPPLIFEDGNQRRDFVSVHDIVRACHLALASPAGRAFNIGSGCSYTVLDVATRLAATLGREELKPVIANQYRVGDIRHCYADISLAREVMGYEPHVSFDEGLEGLGRWLQNESAIDRVAEANQELINKDLLW
jgi:dTDP-L-rhamnose 4-epimerase